MAAKGKTTTAIYTAELSEYIADFALDYHDLEYISAKLQLGRYMKTRQIQVIKHV